MLRVDVDIFSGRKNPAWIVSDEGAANSLLESIAGQADQVVGLPGEGFDGLGYREVVVSSANDDDSWPSVLPRKFSLGTLGARDPAASGEFARRVVADMPTDPEVKLVEHAQTPLGEETRDLVLGKIEQFFSDPPEWHRPKFFPANPQLGTVEDEGEESAAATCYYEVSRFNPDFWNRPEVQPHNNCYNYGRNYRTDTFAQPGRAHGAQTSTMACANVTQAAFADGLVRRYQCLPDSEYPRRLMALVIWPGWDYHFYREQMDDFWGHKPGSTAARNYDNSGVLIRNPETCDRDGYTNFCGYFYAGKSVVIN